MPGAGVEPKTGSAPEIARWLLLWGSDPGSGLCRVELLDPEARKRVVEKIRAGLAERGIALFELALPRDREPEETALGLAGQLRALAPGVVSVSGFAAAFPSGPRLGRFLQALNYQREQLARPELRQIWWMEAHIGQEFTRQIPDLDSWFQIRLSLTEVVPRFEGPPLPNMGTTPKAPMERPSADDVSPREARALLAEAKARIEQTAQRGRLEKGARRSLDRALRELRRAGAGSEAEAEEVLLKRRYPELWAPSAADPEVPSSLHADPLRSLVRSFAILSERLTGPEKSLLTLLAHLAPEPIPLAMLEENEGLLRESAGGDPQFGEALAGLERSSLLSRGQIGDQKTIQLHPLVQAEVLGWIPKEERRTWSDRAVRLVLDYAPEEPQDARNWPMWDRLRPHAARVIEIAEEQNVGGSAAVLMNQLGLFFQGQALFAAAEPLVRRALSIDEASLGKDHPAVATRLNNLAVLLQDTNRLEEAEPLLRRALSIAEASLGEGHPTVATFLNNLARLFKDTNRLEGAEALLRRALAIDEASLGKDHTNVANDLNNLAMLLKLTNRLEEAEPLLHRALAILESSLGKDHPWTSMVRSSLEELLAKDG